jgi:ribonuclease J
MQIPSLSTGEAAFSELPSPGAMLRVIPLGGLEEIGKNMMVFEYGDDIVVVDAGLMFPDESMPGIDLVVQDVSYLEQRREKVRGYVITHGHEDHTGGLPYVLPKAPAPVYAAGLTRGLIEVRLREHKMLDKTEMVTVSPGTSIALGEFRLEFFHQCHSIPDAMGVAIHSPVGTVVHTGDFKFDQTPIDGRVPDYNTLARLGSEGVLALFSDSTRADSPGSTPSEQVVSEAFQRIFARAKGRIIVATFASLISRVQQVVDAAVEHNRRVAIVGRGMINNVSRAIDLGYLRVPSGVLARLDELPHIPHRNLAIVTTGSQGEPTSALTRMAHGDQKHVKIVPDDTIVISSTTIPGNEELVARNIDNLFKLGANVVYDRHEQVHVSGHGAADELKLMIGLLRPKYLVPIHGFYRHLVMHRRLGMQMGIPAERILVVGNGAVLQTDGNILEQIGNVAAGSVFVDGLGVGDIGDVVLRDRRVLSRDGIVVAIVTIDRHTGKPVAGPDIVTRGFVHVSNADALIEKAREVVYDALDAQHSDFGEWQYAKTKIKETLNKFLYENTKRRPMIIPVVMEV